MIKQQLRYIFLCLVHFICVLDAQTKWEIGVETDRKRTDTVITGAAGGFDDFSNPSADVDQLYINFAVSNSQPAANYRPTYSSYNGEGPAPLLPATVKHVFILGDLSIFDTLVLGNTIEGDGNTPIYPPAAYALPTPNVGTTIHFSLTKRPASNPLTWFQGPLPAHCKVVIERESEDPYLDTLLPLNGGYVIIGSPILLPLGFSEKVQHAEKSVVIQRHPDVSLAHAYEKAILILQEDATFKSAVWGVSLQGGFSAEFSENSSLAIPHADAAEAGFGVAKNKIVTLYTSTPEAVPSVNSRTTHGANFLISKHVDKEKLPITSVVPVRIY